MLDFIPFFVLLFFTSPGLGKNVEHSLVFTEGLAAPDGYEQTIILTNGQFPGPQITLDKGDRLVIHVVNGMNKPVAIHVHGILERGSIDSDGAPYVTQELISANSNYTLRPNISTQHGTYMYHGHHEMDMTWAFGAVIIRDSEDMKLFDYSEEHVLLLTHMWHKPLPELLKMVTAYEHVHLPVPTSILINGRSWGNWENYVEEVEHHSMMGHGGGGRSMNHGGGRSMNHGNDTDSGHSNANHGGGHGSGHGADNPMDHEAGSTADPGKSHSKGKGAGRGMSHGSGDSMNHENGPSAGMKHGSGHGGGHGGDHGMSPENGQGNNGESNHGEHHNMGRDHASENEGHPKNGKAYNEDDGGHGKSQQKHHGLGLGRIFSHDNGQDSGHHVGKRDINKKGRGIPGIRHHKENESQSKGDKGTHSQGYTVITVKPNKTYRFRVISLSAKFIQLFWIENHTNFQIIEVDGVLVNPEATDHLELDSGQRYSIILKTNQPIGNYWMTIEGAPIAAPANGRAILHYEGAPDPTTLRRKIFPKLKAKPISRWILDKFRPHTSQLVNPDPALLPVPLEVDREFVFTYEMAMSKEHDFTGFFVNGILHEPSINKSLLARVRAGEDILARKENGVVEIFRGERIQIVFQVNYDFMGYCDHHPWHTHGHTFHIVRDGPDKYDPLVDGPKIQEAVKERTKRGNQYPFVIRDVGTVFPNQSVENTAQGAPCGWMAIRFVADNPGMWQVHCHMAAHVVMRKWFVLYEHEKGKIL